MNIGSIISRCRSVTKRIKRYPLELRFKNDIFLVYTLGKVGSSTIYDTLKSVIPHVDIHHIHFLSDDYLNKILTNSNSYFHKHVELGRSVLDHISKNPNKRIKIITLVRDPVQRQISSLFQVWKGKFGERDLNEVAINEMVNDVKSTMGKYQLEWFDKEFNAFTGIDIYDHKIDQKRNYLRFQENGFDVLVLKLEHLNTSFRPAFKDLLNTDIDELSHANLSKNKVSYNRHKELERKIRFEEHELDEVYSSKYARHFYSSVELSAFKDRWLKIDQIKHPAQ